jgi:hypothetical protein
VLVDHYPVAFQQASQDRLWPVADFSGFRVSRLVASIRSCPPAEQARHHFTLACRTIAPLDVDSVVLLAGDELALAVAATADHPSELSPFVIGLTFGPPGVEPAGTLVPYQLERGTQTVTWKTPRPVRASCTQGLWAEVLGPMCLDRAARAREAPAGRVA